MSQDKSNDHQEQGIEIPYGQLDPATLRNLIQEFVSRDGSDWGDAGGTLDAKVEQVLRQLRSGKVRVVFDLRSQSANLVVCS